MTWGVTRRARAANILADLGKIIAAAGVISPLLQPGPVARGTMIACFLVALGFFGVAVWTEKEDNE